MLKVEATLIPNRVRQVFANIEGFRQVAPLGEQIRLTDVDTGAPQHLMCCVSRAKNTGTIVVVTNVIAPHLMHQVIELEHESSVHVSFFNQPLDVVSRVETLLDALQDCFSYESEEDQAVHKDSMMTHILNNECAYIYI